MPYVCKVYPLGLNRLVLVFTLFHSTFCVCRYKNPSSYISFQPVYYAHLARCYVKGDGATTSNTGYESKEVQCGIDSPDRVSTLNDSDTNSSCIQLTRNEQVPSLPQIKDNIKDFMFFIWWLFCTVDLWAFKWLNTL